MITVVGTCGMGPVPDTNNCLDAFLDDFCMFEPPISYEAQLLIKYFVLNKALRFSSCRQWPSGEMHFLP